jgi:hypothetical protein
MRTKLLLLVGLLAGVTVAGPVPTAVAATFTADSTVDSADLDLSDGLCLTAADGCTLRAAIEQANALGAGPHTITLFGGATYTLTRTGALENAAATGDLDITTNVTIRVPVGRAVVRGGTGWDDRIFHLGLRAMVELNGVEVQNGNPAGSGGGIANEGTLTLANSTVSGNSAGGFGGGIANLGTLTLTDSTVSGNGAGSDGGGIANGGDIATLTATNSTVSGNSTAGFGGGVFNFGKELALTNSTVSRNSATRSGGGLVNWFFTTLTLRNSTVSGNSAGGGEGGGGIYNAGGTLTLTSSTVSGNKADFGGGIYNKAWTTVTNSTVSGNSAVNGGGLAESGTLTLTNSTVSGNNAASDGGGIYTFSATANVNNVTIAKNVADSRADGFGDGGGIFVYSGTVSLANTIVGDNVDASASAKLRYPDCRGTLDSAGYNLVENTTGCTIGGDTTGNITGRDPQLGALQDNGGPTFTHALLVISELGGFTFASPAIDAGSAGRVAACAGVDQRAVGRKDGNADGIARCDMGAYEYVPPAFKLGTLALIPTETTVDPLQRVLYTLSWTVPPGRGWRSLSTLELSFFDDQGIALWLRFDEVAGAPGFFRLVNSKNANAGPAFAPGSPNRLESELATVYLAETAVDGPPGPKVSLTLTLSFKPHAAGRVFDILVAATDDAGEVQGFHRAGTVAASG